MTFLTRSTEGIEDPERILLEVSLEIALITRIAGDPRRISPDGVRVAHPWTGVHDTHADVNRRRSSTTQYKRASRKGGGDH